MPGFIAGWLGILVGRVLDAKDVRDFGLTWDQLTIAGVVVAFGYTVSIMRDLQITRDHVERDLQAFKEEMDERLRAKIAISFDENDPSCIQTTPTPAFTERRLRVRVQNVGGQTIDDTRIVMYLSDTPFNPTPMQIMHEPRTRTSVPLHPGEKRYIDVFGTYEGDGGPTGEVIIFYATTTAPNLIPRTRRAFSIEATGSNIASCLESFELVFLSNQESMIRSPSAPDMEGSLPGSDE